MSASLWLAPAHSGRWLHCPGSLRQIALLPPDEARAKSDDARHGDGCHLVLEKSVDEQQAPAAYIGRSLLLSGRDYDSLPMDQRVFVPTQIDAAAVDHAYQHVQQVAVEAASVEVEHRVDIGAQLVTSVLDPDTLQMVERPLGVKMLGRLDVVIVSIAGGFVEVIDYKHGVRHVSEVENLQQLLYLIGVAPSLPPEVTVARLTIVQPNSMLTDAPIVRTWEVPLSELPAHRERLTEAARRCTLPDAPLAPGAHCQGTFCPARKTCPALAEVAVATLTSTPALTAQQIAPEGGWSDAREGARPPVSLEEAPDAVPLEMNTGTPMHDAIRMPEQAERVPNDLAFALVKSPAELTLDEIANIIEAEDMIRGWLKAVRTHAYRLAMARTKIPRHKLGVGGRTRAWTVDDAALRKRFAQSGKIGEDGKAAGRLKQGDYIVETLLSPAQAEKRIKPLVTPKTWAKIAEMYEWTKGAPVLCAESDTREEYVIPDPAEAFGLTEEGTPASGDAMPAWMK